MNDLSKSGAGLDGIARASYHAALEHLSAHAQWRLRPASATRPVGRRASHWRLGVTMAGVAIAAFAFGIGLQWHQAPQTSSNATTRLASAGAQDPAALMSEDPAFLAWLGGDEPDWLAVQP